MVRKPGRRHKLDRAAVMKYIEDHPTMTYEAVAKVFKSSKTYIGKICRENGHSRVPWAKPQRPIVEPMAGRPLSPAMRHLAQFDEIIRLRIEREEGAPEPTILSRALSGREPYFVIAADSGVSKEAVAGIVWRHRHQHKKKGEA